MGPEAAEPVLWEGRRTDSSLADEGGREFAAVSDAPHTNNPLRATPGTQCAMSALAIAIFKIIIIILLRVRS